MKQKGVYQKYLEMEKQKEKEKKIKEKYGIDENTTIVINEESNFKKSAKNMINALMFILRIVFYIFIIVTSVVGTTILLNLNLRTFFFDYIAKIL